jgi:broad specificity phosphatase PhoE
MRTLEHRRHSRRDPGAPQLNAAGLALARSVAVGLPRFDRVVTSPRPRAVETAEAMGLRVDATVPELVESLDDVGFSFASVHPATFADSVRAVERSAAVQEFATRQLVIWRTELERVPEGGGLLMISHGGLIELGAGLAVPGVARHWGPPLSYLEGVRLTWDGNRWVSGEILRVRE